MEAVAAFSNIGTDNRSGIVQYYGKLKKEKQVQMLERRGRIPAADPQPHLVFPVRFWSIVPTERTVRVSYCKKKGQTPILCCVLSPGEKRAITGQSLYANVTIPGGGFEEAQTLRTKMQNVLDETMESKRSSVAVQGFYLGNLSEEKRSDRRTAAGRYACQNRDQNQDGNLYTVYAYSPCFSESGRQGTTRVKSGTDHVLQQQDAADRNMCGSSGNRGERGKCLIICRRLRMIKRIVSSDNCSMHCQANKNAGIMRDLCASRGRGLRRWERLCIQTESYLMWMEHSGTARRSWLRPGHRQFWNVWYQRPHRNSGGIKTVIWKDHVRDRSIPFPEASKEVQETILEKCCVYEEEALEENQQDICYPDVREVIKQLAKTYDLYIVSNCQCGYIEQFLRKDTAGGVHKRYRVFPEIPERTKVKISAFW